MFAHSLLSGALLLLPIAVTVGVYIGIEFQKIFHGGFSGTYGVLQPGTGAGTTSPDPKDGIQTNMYCQKSVGVTPKGSRYVYNPNQWALTSTEPSRMCMNVTTGTITEGNYASDPWSITWNYTQGPDDQPVHAFANAYLAKSSLPKTLSTVSKIPIDVVWNYGLGDNNATSDTAATLAAADVNANVAFDMFFDPSKSQSMDNTKADHEVMVWLGDFGVSAQPIGLKEGPVETLSINGTVFDLYTGTNGQNQNVWTWVAAATANTFVGDVLPLITTLASHNGPSSSDYMGYMAFGSEAYWSPTNVTFYVSQLSMSVE